MPQVNKHRKVPFSNKQKKEQLKAKRERKRNEFENDSDSDGNDIHQENIRIKRINEQPSEKVNANRNRFNLHFMKETVEEINERKKDASRGLVKREENELEYELDCNSDYLDLPLRPKWSYEMSKDELDKQEIEYFNKYLDNIFNLHDKQNLSYFEMNLETWRQLWRVMELSDCLLIIVDIRYVALQFTPKLYEYATKELNKPCILILNKIDLVNCELVIAWREYFKLKYPLLKVCLYTSQPKLPFKKSRQAIDKNYEDIFKKRKLFGDFYCNKKLYECLKSIFGDKYDLSSFETLIKSRLTNDTSTLYEAKCISNDKGVLTIGLCGCPNVGKSSLLNTLMSRKLVSVSRTPGHTKHFQTLYLTNSIKLCDTPGLVFPLLIKQRSLQILSGIYPIAHLKEPYTCIRFIAEFVDLIKLLKIKHPREDSANDKDKEWSPIDICEAWALKRGYLTAKANRPDYYRAANELLRMCLDGKFGFSLKPKGFTNEIDKWLAHEDTIKLRKLLNEYGYGNDESFDHVLAEDNSDSHSESEENESSEEENEEKSNTQNPFSVLDDE